MVVEARNIIKNELDSYFKEGKKIEKAEIDAKRQEIIKQPQIHPLKDSHDHPLPWQVQRIHLMQHGLSEEAAGKGRRREHLQERRCSLVISIDRIASSEGLLAFQ